MKKYLGEGIGTFGLVFFGGGAVIFGQKTYGAAISPVAFGVALVVMMLSIRPISGAHLNPAVTAAMAIVKRIDGREVLPFIGAQLAGAVAAVAALLGIAGGRPTGALFAAEDLTPGYGRMSPGSYGLAPVLGAEVLLTALFVFVVLGLTQPRTSARSGGATNATAALGCGLAYALVLLVELSIDKGSANPARALAASILVGRLDVFAASWVFVVGPLAGAVLAAVAHRAMVPVQGAQRESASVSPSASSPGNPPV